MPLEEKLKSGRLGTLKVTFAANRQLEEQLQLLLERNGRDDLSSGSTNEPPIQIQLIDSSTRCQLLTLEVMSALTQEFISAGTRESVEAAYLVSRYLLRLYLVVTVNALHAFRKSVAVRDALLLRFRANEVKRFHRMIAKTETLTAVLGEDLEAVQVKSLHRRIQRITQMLLLFSELEVILDGRKFDPEDVTEQLKLWARHFSISSALYRRTLN